MYVCDEISSVRDWHSQQTIQSLLADRMAFRIIWGDSVCWTNRLNHIAHAICISNNRQISGIINFHSRGRLKWDLLLQQQDNNRRSNNRTHSLPGPQSPANNWKLNWISNSSWWIIRRRILCLDAQSIILIANVGFSARLSHLTDECIALDTARSHLRVTRMSCVQIGYSSWWISKAIYAFSFYCILICCWIDWLLCGVMMALGRRRWDEMRWRGATKWMMPMNGSLSCQRKNSFKSIQCKKEIETFQQCRHGMQTHFNDSQWEWES